MRRLPQPKRCKVAVIFFHSPECGHARASLGPRYAVSAAVSLDWGDCFCIRAGVGWFPHSLDSAIVSFGSGFDTVNYNVITMTQNTKAVSFVFLTQGSSKFIVFLLLLKSSVLTHLGPSLQRVARSLI